jgi:hypothetical protein
MAKIVKLVAWILSLLAFCVFVAGYLGGKLIGLEMMAVFQLAFISLISLNSMNPVLGALSKLSFSFGYNKIVPFNYNDKIDISFKGI